MNRIQSVQARASAQISAPADSDRPTVPAPAYAACRAASERVLRDQAREGAALMAAWRATALRAKVAFEMLVEDRLAALRAGASERETWPAPPSSGDWDCEVES